MALDAKTKPPLRRDAQRNREQILTVAATLYAEEGVSTPLEAVARAARVGIGTLYRHFPSRDALLAALLEQQDRILLEHAAAARTLDAPDQALETWLDALFAYLATFNGLPEPLLEATGTSSSNLSVNCDCMLMLTSEFLTAARDAGVARADVDPETLFLAVLGAVWAHRQSGWNASSTAASRALLQHGYIARD